MRRSTRNASIKKGRVVPCNEILLKFILKYKKWGTVNHGTPLKFIKFYFPEILLIDDAEEIPLTVFVFEYDGRAVVADYLASRKAHADGNINNRAQKSAV